MILPVILPVLSCDDCGRCCLTQSSPPFVDEFEQLPRWLAEELLAHVHGPDFDPNAGCPWLSPGGQCEHYDYRPNVCREFELGGEECLQLRRG
jgi:uncharacterized protein